MIIILKKLPYLLQILGLSSELSAQSFTKSHKLFFGMQYLLAHINSSDVQGLSEISRGEQSSKVMSSTATSPM